MTHWPARLGHAEQQKWLLLFVLCFLLCVVVCFANSVAQNTAARNTCSCHHLLPSQGCSPWLELHKQPGRMQVCHQVMANHFEWQNVLLLKDLRCNGQRSNTNNFIILATGMKITEASLSLFKEAVEKLWWKCTCCLGKGPDSGYQVYGEWSGIYTCKDCPTRQDVLLHCCNSFQVFTWEVVCAVLKPNDCEQDLLEMCDPAKFRVHSEEDNCL